jgi:hypothetical protein
VPERRYGAFNDQKKKHWFHPFLNSEENKSQSRYYREEIKKSPDPDKNQPLIYQLSSTMSNHIKYFLVFHKNCLKKCMFLGIFYINNRKQGAEEVIWTEER